MNLYIILSFLVSTAHASFWDGQIDTKQTYACIGIDGVPIGYSSPLSSTCCNSSGELIANAPSTCRAGYNSITADAGTGAAGGINLAQQTISTSGGLGGSNMDTSGDHTNIGGQTANPASESMASLANGSGVGDGSASNSAGIKSNESTGAGSKSGGSGSGGAGGGGVGLGLGTSGGTSGIKGDGADPNNIKANNGGYVKSGDGKGAGGNGGGLFGGLFGGGSGGAGAGAGGAGGPNELAFGDGAGGDANGEGANGANEDGDGKGSAEDPNDYFNRIDKSANIFKIVSARYMKKKSLWLIPKKI